MRKAKRETGASGDLFAPAASPPNSEVAEVLASMGGCRIERIVSFAHQSPPGFWYDQPGAEWVALLAGKAEIAFADGRRHELAAGNWLLISAHERHRVAWTSAEPAAVWLAVHLPPAEGWRPEPAAL